MGRVAIRFIQLLAAIASGVAVIWLCFVAGVLLWGARDDAPPSSAIVVLGAAQYAGRPSPVLKARLDHAVELWERRLSKFVVVTGGRGSGDTTSEAAVSAGYMLKHGVPESAILAEGDGRTSSESMRAVSTMLQSRHATKVILVSDPFHMLRLWIIAKRMGLEPHTSPTRTSPISPNREQRWRYILSESIKAPLTFFFEREL